MIDIFDVGRKCKNNDWWAYVKGDYIYLQNEVGEVACIGDIKETKRPTYEDIVNKIENSRRR